MKMILSALAALALLTTKAAADSSPPAVEPKTPVYRESVVEIGRDAELKADESAREVVVIGGSGKILGDVRKDVVVIGGDVEVDGDVGGNVVVMMGDAHLGPKAAVHHDLVSVGGRTDLATGAVVHGRTQEVGVGMGLPRFLRLQWLRDWVRLCAFKLRPLSLHVGWVWWIVGILFLLYFLIATLFPYPVQSCLKQATTRPATSFAIGIVTKLAVPIVCLLLAFTVVGALVVPFVIVAEILALVVGKVAILEYVGGKITGLFGLKEGERPMAMFLAGALVVTALYLVPILGLLTFLMVGLWGLGAGVTALFVSLRRENVAVPAGPPPLPPVDYSSMPPVMPTSPPPHALAFPRAGFWERMAAAFLDLLLLGIVVHWLGPLWIFAAVAYFSGMWAWKGTTIGGIVLSLQVVKQDGQPLHFLTAFVRSLAAIFSFVILFLGFFWIAWDRDKQGWHDKIAGTVVVRLPKAISLVCV